MTTTKQSKRYQDGIWRTQRPDEEEVEMLWEPEEDSSHSKNHGKSRGCRVEYLGCRFQRKTTCR
jgi:hypothetical protein